MRILAALAIGGFIAFVLAELTIFLFAFLGGGEYQ